MTEKSKIKKFRFSWKVFGISVGGIAVVALLGLWIFFGFFMSFVDKHELGFIYHKLTGEIEVCERTGWIKTFKPFNPVHSIDQRPYQVAISANERILNAKLVQFDPAGLNTFIEWHGRDAGDSLSNLKEILKCYAFDKANGEDCPFLKIHKELAPPQGIPSSN